MTVLAQGRSRVLLPTDRPSDGSGLWMLVSSFVLSVLIPLTLLASIPDAGRSGAHWLTLLIAMWSGLRLSWLISRGEPRVFEFMFWMFVYLFFGLAATVQMRGDLVASTTPDIPSQLDWPTAFLLAGSLVAFEVGRLLARGPRIQQRLSTRGLRPINPVAVWSLFLVGAVVNIYNVQDQGLPTFFQARDALAAARVNTFSDSPVRFIVTAVSWVPLLVAAGGFLWMRRERRAAGLPGRYGVFALLSAIGVLIVDNPISGARFTSGTAIFALIAFLGAFTTKARVRLAFSAIVAAFIFLFPIADAFRHTTTGVDVNRAGFFTEYAGNGDYDSVWQVANSLLFVHTEGVTFGRQFLGVVLFWVPRTSWADKPIDTGTLLANFRGYSFTNLSAPLWAEGVMNGGVVLAIALLLVLGFVLHRIDLRLPRAMRQGGVVAITAAMLPAYMIIILRGSLLQATGLLVLIVLCLVVVAVGPRRRSGPTASAPADGAELPEPLAEQHHQ